MAAPGGTRFEQQLERQSSSHNRRVKTMLFLCCCCSSLLLLPFCQQAMKSSFWHSYSLIHTKDVVAESSFDKAAAKSELWTSVSNPSELAAPVAVAPPAKTARKTFMLPEGEKYMWYCPHEGFSNQARELQNALKIAFLLNRTLVVPPLLDHFELEQGTCFTPLRDQRELRKLSWEAITDRFDFSDRRAYVSIADIIDLTSIKPIVKTIDLRVFLAMWCGIDISPACFGPVCRRLARKSQSTPQGSISSCAAQFFSTHEGSKGPILIHEVHDDCRTTVWTSGESISEKVYLEELLRQQLQNDTTLPSDVNASSIFIKRKDVIETLGRASTAAASFLLAFGTLFSRYYNDRTLMVDIAAFPRGNSTARILTEIEHQTFTKDILDAGRYFVQEKIEEPFFCAHMRLGDGIFLSDRGTNVFEPLRQRLEKLEVIGNQTTSGPLNLFVMTDVPRVKWKGTYLNDLYINPKYKIHTMDGQQDLLHDVVRKIDFHEYGIVHSPQLENLREAQHKTGWSELNSGRFLDREKHALDDFEVRLFVEEVVCSCATLGFQGTLSSTITRNVWKMREAKKCPIWPSQFSM